MGRGPAFLPEGPLRVQSRVYALGEIHKSIRRINHQRGTDESLLMLIWVPSLPISLQDIVQRFLLPATKMACH